MFKRKKTRIAPQVDDYVRRRYEDLAVCIAHDIANNRGLVCYYTPWLDHMMGKFNFPLDYRARHSLVAMDLEGRHIGCSGAVKNTLVYYNPISPGCEGEAQFQEAVTKSRLSERFKGKRERQKSMDERSRKESNAVAQSSEVGRSEIADNKASSGTSEDRIKTLIQEDLHSAVTPAEGVTCGSNAQAIMAKENVRQNATGPKYITEDGVVHVVNELRPQSADSYYARIDEAFRKHRPDISKPTSGVADLAIRSETAGFPEEFCIDEARTLGSNKERVARSRFCTIL